MGQLKKQKCLLLTRDHQILDINQSIMKDSLINEKEMRAWGQTPHTLIPKRGTNRVYQIIDEYDSTPLALDGKIPRQVKPIQAIAVEAREKAQAENAKNAKREKFHDYITILVLVLGVTICLLTVAGLIQAGKLKVEKLDFSMLNPAFIMMAVAVEEKKKAEKKEAPPPGNNKNKNQNSFVNLLSSLKNIFRKSRTDKPQENKYPAVILDPYSGWHEGNLESAMGSLWRYKNRWVYLVKHIKNKNGEMEYRPYDPYITNFDDEIKPAKSKELKDAKKIPLLISPEKLYRALRCREIAILFNLNSDRLQKIKLGLMVGLVGILLFFLYLIFSNIKGV